MAPAADPGQDCRPGLGVCNRRRGGLHRRSPDAAFHDRLSVMVVVESLAVVEGLVVVEGRNYRRVAETMAGTGAGSAAASAPSGGGGAADAARTGVLFPRHGIDEHLGGRLHSRRVHGRRGFHGGRHPGRVFDGGLGFRHSRLRASARLGDRGRDAFLRFRSAVGSRRPQPRRRSRRRQPPHPRALRRLRCSG